MGSETSIMGTGLVDPIRTIRDPIERTATLPAIVAPMRHNPKHAVTDEAVVRRLIAEHPWATFVSHNGRELVASHYPALLDDTRDDLAIVTHVGRPDEALHAFAPDRELLVIFAGPHGYISPSWYTPEMTQAPTWNFSTAHCYGHPQLLDADENLAVLTRLVDHFERHVERPVPLEPTFGARLAKGTVGLRVPIDRFVCKVKMSQDKDAASQREVIAQLRGDGPYAQPALADDMERTLGEG
jgi:transcriptional regulator